LSFIFPFAENMKIVRSCTEVIRIAHKKRGFINISVIFLILLYNIPVLYVHFSFDYMCSKTYSLQVDIFIGKLEKINSYFGQRISANIRISSVSGLQLDSPPLNKYWSYRILYSAQIFYNQIFKKYRTNVDFNCSRE
jgi:hypothetical protein